MTLDELKIIRKALTLLVPRSIAQARAEAEAIKIVDREIEAAQQSVQADTKPRTAQEELDELSDQLAANHAKLQKALRR